MHAYTHIHTHTHIPATNPVATFFAQERLELGHDVVVPMVRAWVTRKPYTVL